NLTPLVRAGEVNRVVITHIDDCCFVSSLGFAETVLDGVSIAANAMPPWIDDGNPCTVDACDALLGVIHTPTPSGTSCAIGDSCTGPCSCDGKGACIGASVDVDDGNPCTLDACDPLVGVTHQSIFGG